MQLYDKRVGPKGIDRPAEWTPEERAVTDMKNARFNMLRPVILAERQSNNGYLAPIPAGSPPGKASGSSPEGTAGESNQLSARAQREAEEMKKQLLIAQGLLA